MTSSSLKLPLPAETSISYELPMTRVVNLGKQWESAGLLASDEFLGLSVSGVDTLVSNTLLAARGALGWARYQTIELPGIDSEARRANEVLAALLPLLNEVRATDCWRTAQAFSQLRGNAIDTHGSLISAHLQHIVDASAFLSGAIERLYKTTNLRPAKKHQRGLSHFFISAMRRPFEEALKRKPPRGKTGPFVKLVSAAWLDFSWPVPDGQRDDVEGWLGQQIEKHPLLTERRGSK